MARKRNSTMTRQVRLDRKSSRLIPGGNKRGRAEKIRNSQINKELYTGLPYFMVGRYGQSWYMWYLEHIF